MEMLNDDCLVTIFKMLDLKDQLTLAQVCRHFKALLQQYIWAIHYKKVALNFYELNLNMEEFRTYISCIFPFAEAIRIKELSAPQFEVMKGGYFPNTRDFRFSQKQPLYMCDDDLLTLSEIFPNLDTFSPQGNFTGRHLECFQHLQHLTLSYCNGLVMPHICAVLRMLDLRTLKLNTFHSKVAPLGAARSGLYRLERLLMNEFELDWLYELDDPSSFDRLKELVITDMLSVRQTYKFLKLLGQLGEGKVKKLEFSNSSCAYQFMKKSDFSFFRYIEKLSFLNVTGIADIGCYTKISENFPVLRELHFHSCYIGDVNSILRLFDSDLDLLNVEDCSTGFPEIKIKIFEIKEQRRKPITFNFLNNVCRNSDMTEPPPVALIVSGGESPLLKVTSVASKYINYSPIRVVFG